MSMLAYVHSPVMQMSQKISGVAGPQVHQIFIRRKVIIVDVNATIGVAIFLLVVDRQHTE